MSTHTSKACCETPAAVSEGYAPKGTYETFSNTKCYITGPKFAKKAIFFVFDIFGFTEQTLQGADILASGGKEEYLVVMPDLFDGKPVQPEWFARDTEEKKQKVAQFMAGIQDPQPHIDRIQNVLEAAKGGFSRVEKWGAIGYCWGGKMVSLTSGANTPWTAAVESSPAHVDAEDGKKTTIPFAILASKDEPADAVKAKHEALTTPKIVHIFDKQVHGWMSARADLKDPEVKKEYERGYQITLDFFDAHL